MATKPKTRVDPELRRQLDTSAEVPGPVQAVLRLRSAKGAGTERTKTDAAHVVRRVAKELGAKPGEYDFNVFPNLGYFVLSASSAFVECVVRQPEIASASANRRSS